MSPQENLCLGSIIVRFLAVWQIPILNIKIWHIFSRKLQDEYKLEAVFVSLKFKLSLSSHDFLIKRVNSLSFIARRKWICAPE